MYPFAERLGNMNRMLQEIFMIELNQYRVADCRCCLSFRQVFAITALEYFFLGALAAFTGIVLALIGAALLARFSFDTGFTPPLLPTLLIFLAITGLTVLIGLLNSRSVLKAPPLSILNSGS